MKVRVKYFALLREAVGRDSEQVDWQPERPAVEDFLEYLGRRHDSLRGILEGHRVLCALNQEYVDGGEELKEGDELALFPPVSGG